MSQRTTLAASLLVIALLVIGAVAGRDRLLTPAAGSDAPGVSPEALELAPQAAPLVADPAAASGAAAVASLAPMLETGEAQAPAFPKGGRYLPMPSAEAAVRAAPAPGDAVAKAEPANPAPEAAQPAAAPERAGANRRDRHDRRDRRGDDRRGSDSRERDHDDDDRRERDGGYEDDDDHQRGAEYTEAGEEWDDD